MTRWAGRKAWVAGFLVAVLFSRAAFADLSGATARILGRWVDALGGIKSLQNVKSVCIRSTLETGGLRGIKEECSTSSGQHWESVALEDGAYKLLKVLDERGRGWVRDQNGRVRELEGFELAHEISSAFLGSFSHLVGGRMRGRVESSGRSERPESQTVQILPQKGSPVMFYFDTLTGLPARAEMQEEELTHTTFFEDWRQVDGVKFPFGIRSSTGDVRYDVTESVQQVEFNVAPDRLAFDKPAGAGPDFRFGIGSSSQEIPADILKTKTIFVQASINGSAPSWFLLDSGAGSSVIDSGKAEELGLSVFGHLPAGGVGEAAVDVGIVRGVSLGLLGVQLVDQTLLATSLAALSQEFGRPIAGLLGYDFFSRFVVEIDYRARTLSLFDPATSRQTAEGESLPITLEGNTPHVSAKLLFSGNQNVRGRFLVDTGAEGALDLGALFVKKYGLLSRATRTVQGFVTGMGGRIALRFGQARAVQIGRLTVTRPSIGLSETSHGAMANPVQDGVIGGSLLSRFKVTFDYAHKRLTLAPTKDLAPSLERNTK